MGALLVAAAASASSGEVMDWRRGAFPGKTTVDRMFWSSSAWAMAASESIKGGWVGDGDCGPFKLLRGAGLSSSDSLDMIAR